MQVEVESKWCGRWAISVIHNIHGLRDVIVIYAKDLKRRVLVETSLETETELFDGEESEGNRGGC